MGYRGREETRQGEPWGMSMSQVTAPWEPFLHARGCDSSTLMDPPTLRVVQDAQENRA